MSTAVQISSSSNSQYRVFLSLLTSKGIKKEGLFFLMGTKLIQEYLADEELKKQFPVQFILYKDLIPSDLKLPTTLKKSQLTSELFNELDVLATHYPLLVVAFSKLHEKNLLQPPKGLEIICPLGDPKNLGALIRSAVGFGCSELILTSEAAHPYLPQSIKASAGAALKINLTYSKQKNSELPVVGHNYALDLKGKDICSVEWPADLRLWVGEEGPGLRLSEAQNTKIKKISIKTAGIESLNATVSTSIALWQWKQNQNK